MKKYEPKQRNLENRHYLDGQPGRDHKALILPLSAIKVKENIRNEITGIAELASNIEINGLLQPLVVRKDQSSFVLIAGHRRHLALKHLGWKEVPVRLQDVSEEVGRQLTVIENIVREDLTGVEEVTAVASLLPLFEGNQSALARVLGKSQPYVSRCVRAAELIKGYATSHSWTKSILFEVTDSKDPKKAMEILTRQERPTVQTVRHETRKPSGPISGGHAVDRVIRYNERRNGRGFTLKVHFDFERSSEGDRERLLSQLRELIKKLEARE